MMYSRRQFAKWAVTSVPCAAAVLANPARMFAAAKPDSKFNGVQIGVISYSYRQMQPFDALAVLEHAQQDGINAVELENVQEWYAGAPRAPQRPMPNRPTPGMQIGEKRPEMTPEQKAAQVAYAEELTSWRISAPMDKYIELRKRFNDAGIEIYAFKITLTKRMPDAEYDYAFKAAKACGANQITMEMPEDTEVTRRIGEFANKHKMMVGYHAHLQATPNTWDEAMAQSPYNGINLDLGHYTAAGNTNHLEFVRKNHARITSMHLKDRKSPAHGGANAMFGEGDTPIREVLQLMKKEGYKFPVTIELEYVIPEGSDPVKEVARCKEYAKAALV